MKTPFAIPVVFALAGALCSDARGQGQLQSVPLTVPDSLRSGTFATPRSLNVPPGWTASLYAVCGGARFMTVGPNGDVFVVAGGLIRLLRPGANGAATVTTFATGFDTPHDIVFHKIDAQWWLYVGEKNKIRRMPYTLGNTVAQPKQDVVTGLPDNSLPELGGAYGHVLKNIALGVDHTLFVSIASASNADPADRRSDPIRCSIYAYDADGSNRRLYATGLRNAEGLAIDPTGALWVAVNNRDNTRYPYQNGPFPFGALDARYVDDHPPDEFTKVVPGADYGWPYANPNPDTLNGMDFPPVDPDYDNNRLWANFPKSQFTPVSKGIQAHSAALGLTFFQGTALPASLRDGVAVALHGSWNRRDKTGYKVVYFPWFAPGNVPLAQQDLVAGFLSPDGSSSWDRPVDTAVMADGSLLVSGDQAGGIYRLTPPADGVNGFLGATTRALVRSVDPATVTGDYRVWPSRTARGTRVSDYGFVGPGTVETTPDGMRSAGRGTGFALQVAAETEGRGLVLEVASSAGGRLEVRLSDGSAPAYVTRQPAGRREITVSYRATRPGVTLHVIWTADGDGDAVIRSARVNGGRRR